jgi:OTU domain-containing protein 3
MWRKSAHCFTRPLSSSFYPNSYHDWEHFSSIRNLRGPHSGLPNVSETPSPEAPVEMTPRDREKEAKREREKERREKEKARKIPRVKLKLSAPSPAAETAATEIPLPESQPSSADSTQVSLPTGALSPAMRIHRSPKRSFDESTSSEDGHSVDDIERSGGRDKRSRPSRLGVSVGDAGDETDSLEKEREETPGLSAPGSSSSSSSAGDEEFSALEATQSLAAATGLDDGYSSLSELESSPEPEPAPVQQSISAPVPPSQESATPDSTLSKRAQRKQQHLAQFPAHHSSASARPGGEKPLTRRQRKALGLPKARAALVFGRDNNSPGAGVGAGKIVIPGGRFKGRAAVKVREFREGEDEDGADGLEAEAGVSDATNGEVEEWVRTGVGRVDVRGFRELKI